MAGNQTGSDGTVRPRVAASSARLTSLRTSTDASAAPARRPKFVPKAAKRRPASEGRAEGSATGPQRSNDAKPHSSGAGALKNDNRGRGGRGRGGRGGGRGRGRGRGVMPSGKVAFVGTLSGGSSYSGGGSAPAPRATPAADFSAAGGTGISVLDDEEMPGGKQPEGMEVDEVWPPVVKSVMEPMSLPIARPPEPQSAGAVFCDASGDVVAPDDSLFFIQMPTTLPLSSAITKGPATSTDEDESMERTEEAKEETKKRNPEESPDDGVFDHSIETAPGGFVGKICVHKSGKMVLVLGDKQFEVAAAQTPSFCEEIYAVNTTEKHLSMLGNVERHLVVTPDFEVLLH